MTNRNTISNNPLLLALNGQLKAQGGSSEQPSKEWRQNLTGIIKVDLERRAREKKSARGPAIKLKKAKGKVPVALKMERQKALDIYQEIREVFPGYGRLGADARRSGQNLIQVPGTGEENFPYPTPHALKAAAKRRLFSWMEEVDQQIAIIEAIAGGNVSEPNPTPSSVHTDGMKSARRSNEEELGATLFEQARGVESKLADGKLEPALARRFAYPKGEFQYVAKIGSNQEQLKKCLEEAGTNEVLKNAILELDKEPIEDFKRMGKLQPAALSLELQRRTAEELYREVLPGLLLMLEGMYPQLPEEMLIEVAAQAIDQELMLIHYVMWVWADIFSQDRNRFFVKERASIDEFIDGCFDQFISKECGKCGDTCRNLLATMTVGGKFKCRFEADGPSTLPAQAIQARGPSGADAAHAVNIPFNMEKITAFVKVIFAHEFMHDIFADIQGKDGGPSLEQELLDVVDRALVTASKKAEGERGRLKLSTPHIMVGEQKVKTITVLRKVFADTLNEMNADISGGILLTGPAFLDCMIVTFKALYGPILRRYGRDNKFPNETIYTADEEGRIEMEAHLPPYIRAKIVRFALENLGFKKEAKKYGKLTDQATELDELPKFATWFDAEGAFPNIDIPCVDLEAAGRFVVKAIMSTKLQSLNGRSMRQLMNYTRESQDRVDVLVKIMIGELTMDDVPTGSILVTDVAAAAVLAHRRLVEKNETGRKALEHLQQVEPLLHDVAVKRSREAKKRERCEDKE
ncbi:MAG: hypothetical protein K2Y22_06720 [Candidatus Obscuribacterales bacterium]|nr:hypothetical protein [Candidatus Obscuribacterales bacterium]